MTLSNTSRSFAAAAAAAVAALAVAGAATAQDAANVRMATVGVGSSWYNYGAGIAELAMPYLPEGSVVDVLPVAGGVGNVKLIQAGEAEFGMSFANTAAEGCRGFGAFDFPHDKVRGMIGGLDVYYFAAFATEASGVESWADIAAAKNGFDLVTATVGGTGELAVRQVLGLLGTSIEEIDAKGGSVRAVARADTGSVIADGTADGWSHIVTRGHPVATELTTSNDMVMIGLPDEIASGMVSEYGWVRATAPAGMFDGQDSAIETVKTGTTILVHADVPEHVVYAMTKAIYENAEKLPTIHAALSDFDATAKADPGLVGNCAWHPGAERYYREAGLL